MAVRMNASESGGFKLLEEDALDDRPCAAVKKFVSSVLERKDMKDADVANSFRNLMEYRDSTSSPSQCSVSTSTSALDSDRLDRLNSPPSPSSPPGPMDDQRLPNELLDEICEDIGMKEGMELDFVEYLMEQDTNPQMYMTPEAISSSGAFNSGAGSTISTPTGSASGGSNSGSSGSNNNNSSINNNNNNDSANKTLTLLSTPSSTSSNTTTPNFLFKPNFSESDWLSQLPSPLIPTSSGPSSGATTIQSSENNSPANKRIHLSASTDTSPNKGRSQTPPGFNQHGYQSGGYSNGMGMAFAPTSSSSFPGGYHSNNNHQNMFKMPQAGPPPSTAGPPKRSHSYPQGAPASSPVHSTTSSLGSHSSSSSLSHSHSSATAAASQYPHHQQHHNNHQQQQQQHHQSAMRGPHEFSMNPPSDASDQEDSLSNNNNNIKNTNNNKVPCVSPKPIVPTSSSSSSSSSSIPFIKPGSPVQANQTSMTNSGYGQNSFGARDGSVFQRVGKPPVVPPPNVNVKSMQEQQQHHHHQQHPQNQQRWMGPPQKQGPMPGTPGGFYGGKSMYPGAAYPMGMSQPAHPHPHHMPHHHHPHHHMGPPGPHTAPVRPPADSPLDQGYFSNESAGNCSSGSAPSPAFTTSSMSSFSSISTMMPADQSSSSLQMQQQQQQQQKSSMMQSQQHPGMQNGRPQSQKSVHFADMPSDTSPPAYPQDPTAVPNASGDVKPVFGQSQPTSSSTPPDCAFEADGTGANSMSTSNGQPKSGKILPRFNHSSKSGAAPYTVPNQGMVMGPSQQQGGSPSHGQHPAPSHPPPNYDFSNRSSCALSGNNKPGSGRDSSSPGEAMQAEFGSRPSSQTNISDGSFFMDGGSGIVKSEVGMAEFPPPLPPHQPGSGDFSNSMQQQQTRYGPGMEHFSSMQQQHPHQHHQLQHQQQQQHFHSSMQHPHPSHLSQQQHPHPHDPQQQQHQQQPPQFPSCSHSGQPQDFGAMHHSHPHPHNPQQSPHNSSMQIASNGSQPSPGGFQMPLAMSTPLSAARPGPSPRMGGSAGPNSSFGPHMYPQGYDGYNPYHTDMYSQQNRWRGAGGPEDQHQHQQQLQVQVGGMPHPQHQMGTVPPSPMKGGVMQGPHPHPPQGLPHMQPSPTPAAAAPMGPGPPNPGHPSSMPHHHPHQMPDMNGGMMGGPPSSSTSSSCAGPPPPHPNMAPGPHPEYGPCMGMNCTACKMAQSGNPSCHPQHPHMGPCADPAKCHSCKGNGMPMVGGMPPPPPPHPPHHLNHHGSHPHQPQHPPSHPGGPLPPPPPGGPQHMGPCQGPNCAACKVSQAHRPQMLSSQQKFIQHLIMDEGNAAYRSHPLFPLLRDLVIAEMNFDNPRFHYQQLLSLLPNDFHKLLQNFLHRNPPSGHYQSNQAVESVIMDSLRLAHSNLVDKIRLRQEMEKMKANSSASLRSMEEFCQKFDHSVNGPMGRPMPNTVGPMGMGHPMAGYEGSYIPPGMAHLGQFRAMKDGPDMLGETALSAATAAQQGKTESKKHPSLPKEAVAMMMEWLRNHKDNPYPNDDEKAMLIKQTGLSINQINYWFTNARRRILPKWAQCKT